MRLRVVLLGAMLLVLVGFTGRGFADVSFNIGITPPALVINGPPEVAVIPGTYVYFCPDISADIFFYDGFWYRPYEGRWYRSVSYEGPWGFIVRTEVPSVFFSLPPHFRSMEYHRIPFGEFHDHWRAWGRDKHWDKVGWGRHEFERERHHGIAPSFRGGREGERHELGRGAERERHETGRSMERGRERH